MDRKKKVTLILVSLLCVAVIFVFARKKLSSGREVAIEDMSQKLEQKILSFDLVNYANNGVKKWQLKGDSADILAEVVNLTNINMETYDEPKIFLTASSGAYDRDNKVISLFDDVVVLTSEGTMLITDYLKWNGITDTIITDKPVRIERGDVIAEGNGAQAFPQMKKIVLDKDVRVRLAGAMMDSVDFNLKGGESEEGAGKAEADDIPARTIITCSGKMEMNYEENIAIFNDNVVVEDKKGKIYSDKMEAFLNPVTKSIEKVVAEGDVKVVRGEDSTYSQKAVYTTADQKIILIGKPRIYIRSTDQMEHIEEELEAIR